MAEDDLASIVTLPDRWKRMVPPEEANYAGFHARFWGTKMEAPERPSPLNHPSISKPQLEIAQMDVDVETDNDESIDHSNDEDNIPGCHVLDVEPFPDGNIWIRAEYIRIFNHAFKFFEDDRGLLHRRPPLIVLTGQPGIGKCRCWDCMLILDLSILC
jgi:hypothetical protein